MKTIIIVFFAVMCSTSSFATDGSTTIENSDLSAENQIAVANAVQEKCGYMRDLTQILPTIQTVDYQETGDIFLKIQLSGSQKSEQFIYNDYLIYVDAVIPNINGHGFVLAQVTDVRCEIQ